MPNDTIALSYSDAGQILNGIEVLIEQWEAVADYHRAGQSGIDICTHEAKDAHEADSIAATYRDIRDQITSQIQQTQST